ncbi:Maltose-binding protein MalE [Lentzea waywayandensis]|uniref:Maltose-binding protein MalE n=1 Tax=Lentzea waywayandensis TaxID=84724 RepID=A0A1I6FFP6_9PSEU|nr:extracellular solute-binding protein [Lentzea waywayandensis]SFR28748.1 Maltose-binding protein MalE [Lentzea waywayandensis]
MTVQWGDVAGWLQGLGSLSALGFAAAAVVVTRRTYRIESERDQVNAAAREARTAFDRRAQAALVSAWWGSNDDGVWGAFVRNASETPVYQVYVTVVGADDRSDGHKSHYLVVPPGTSTFTPINGDTVAAPARRVKVSFTDAAGVRWQRNQYGRLTELQSTLCITADPPRVEALREFKDDFLASYGVTVEFRMNPPGYLQREFVADIERNPGTDALICPHDWLGDLISRDLIEPTVLSAEHHAACPEWALEALTVDGRLYGLPTTMDTVALFRNTRLAPQPPATFDQLIASGLTLRNAGRVREVFAVRVGETGDPFQIWPLFTGAGGCLFGRHRGGGWDPTRIGLAAPGSVAAFERLRELGEAGTKMLRRSIGKEEALELFATGHTPYLLSTSDALKVLREAATPFAISAVPPFADGAEPDPFTLVHGLVMTKAGTSKIIAHDLFADYLTHDHVISALAQGVIAPAVLRGSPAKDPDLQQFVTLCEAGTPMPSFPQMYETWRILAEAEVAVIGGASAEATAKHAAARVSALFS